MYYVRYPLGLLQVEDRLHEHGINVTHETIQFRRNNFGTLFAKESRNRRIGLHSNLRWHTDDITAQQGIA